MILTGRPVRADEALAFGLANRVVEDGTAREEAETLAAEIAEFPTTCMRGDRSSTYEQFDLDFPAAMQNEFQHGMNAYLVRSLSRASNSTRAGVAGTGNSDFFTFYL